MVHLEKRGLISLHNQNVVNELVQESIKPKRNSDPTRRRQRRHTKLPIIGSGSPKTTPKDYQTQCAHSRQSIHTDFRRTSDYDFKLPKLTSITPRHTSHHSSFHSLPIKSKENTLASTISKSTTSTSTTTVTALRSLHGGVTFEKSFYMERKPRKWLSRSAVYDQYQLLGTGFRDNPMKWYRNRHGRRLCEEIEEAEKERRIPWVKVAQVTKEERCFTNPYPVKIMAMPVKDSRLLKDGSFTFNHNSSS